MFKMSELVECRLEECNNTFKKKVHNQSFCSKDCCRVYTNRRILAQYHEKKNRKIDGRICATKKCGTILSIYNDDSYCGVHQRVLYLEKLRSWGWEIDEEKLG